MRAYVFADVLGAQLPEGVQAHPPSSTSTELATSRRCDACEGQDGGRWLRKKRSQFWAIAEHYKQALLGRCAPRSISASPRSRNGPDATTSAQMIAFAKGIAGKHCYESRQRALFRRFERGGLWPFGAGYHRRTERAGIERVEGQGGKRSRDFAIWRKTPAGGNAADGVGFARGRRGAPGWHLECSVMSGRGAGGFPFDIHTGGNRPPQNPPRPTEIAQNQAVLAARNGGRPGNSGRATIWMHQQPSSSSAAADVEILGRVPRLQIADRPGVSPLALPAGIVPAWRHYRSEPGVRWERAGRGLTRLSGW